MIRRRHPLKRGGRELQRSAVKHYDPDIARMIDSGGERDWLGRLRLLERAGEIRNLRLQVTHQLYVGDGLSQCSCQWPKGKEMPIGMMRVYSPRLDFEFEERASGIVAGGQVERRLVYADAKGWMDPESKQYLGYKLFAAIHGQEIRLLRTPRRRRTK
jgi:hypothetical protein